MAYLDDNNDNLYTQGDPLEDLDRELAELKATLGKLENDPPAVAQEKTGVPQHEQTNAMSQGTTNAPLSGKADERSIPDKPSVPLDDGKPAYLPPAPAVVRTVRDEQPQRVKTPKAAEKPRKKGRLPVIILAVVLSAVLIIGVGYAVFRLLLTRDSGDTSAISSGEMVTISDSVMGDIELKTVKGAEINTYTKDNLVIDESGVPSYYEDGVKISHLGVDLSEYQGEVDFAAVKNSGVEFVMLRIGGRFYGESGGMYSDSAFDSYYEQAKAAGLKIGAYFFSQAASAEDAREEAEYALSLLDGRALDYPIALDWENIENDEARTDNVTGDILTAIAETFCDTIIEAGYKAIVYSNTQQMFVMYDFETMKDYDFWLADYRDFPTMYYKFDMWQYSMTGSVDGVEGTVDMNISFTDFSGAPTSAR